MKSAKRAFTLIEIIVSLVLIGIISIPLSMMVMQHIQGTAKAEDYTVALNLGRWAMEETLKAPYISPSPNPSTLRLETGNDYFDNNFNICRTIKEETKATEAIETVSITISQPVNGCPPKEKDSTILFNLVTYITKNISYGQ